MIYGNFKYKNPTRKLIAFDVQGVLSALECIESTLKSKPKGYFVGYMTYEAGVLLQAYQAKAYIHLSRHLKTTISPYKQPLLYFAYFTQRHKCKNLKMPHHTPFSLFALQGLDNERYKSAFKRIKEYILKGESYQINYTQELKLYSKVRSKQLFKEILLRQNTAYKAYIKNTFGEILCFSPELFFKVKNRTITAQPMKGTIKRAKIHTLDSLQKRTLQQDRKNRSENMMIVDLLRNDLSKIIKPNSLHIKNLCAIKSYPTLFQMVSTLQGKISKHTSLRDIFCALFPCGSITGAPKLKTMEIIQSLESRQRGVYCGALGVISAKKMSFCVPIRTLFKSTKEDFYRYGVGSGVVWDSVCESEYAELALKTHFLQAIPLESFALFETMLFDNGRIFLLKEHLERLLRSARQCGFDVTHLVSFVTSFRESYVPHLTFSHLVFPHIESLAQRDCVKQAQVFFTFCKQQMPQERAILRLSLLPNGSLNLVIKPFVPHRSTRVILSAYRQDSHNLFLRHKSTQRAHFADSVKLIESGAVFDVLYCNQKGELCEGARSNIVLEIEGRFYTPKRKSGLLSGTLAQVLLQSGAIEAKTLTHKHLAKAQTIYCINSVRGIVQVQLDK
ncbi:bifunctional anthranilate synthase component I family protein/class IV aminotransferase [Helicobacter sp. MIT 21-1697]|uniref:bifunctional chorismate-binding protein/class IV aminotransferase n=1 Tax=Helicobacter sp. MIT 21-1697 TaxID=2993733 RepID=UPI00224A761A|nr:bifunctional anthranilate synthase component I family protein/class IV aminotransferase [Helicobacter sp. MIT 21-1697]MCX2717327.1 bifunctional anthranilate synthase component I family protein/class IV aminotransferase [Helicobacter sp. MIT 21-1697]